MLRSEFRPTHLLMLLFGGALVLSFGLNVVLLKAHVETWPEDDDELVTATAELQLTQRLLTQCQGRQQQQQDSLLVLQRTSGVAPATSHSAFYSTK